MREEESFDEELSPSKLKYRADNNPNTIKVFAILPGEQYGGFQHAYVDDYCLNVLKKNNSELTFITCDPNGEETETTIPIPK